jgi:hypothetical protein
MTTTEACVWRQSLVADRQRNGWISVPIKRITRVWMRLCSSSIMRRRLFRSTARVLSNIYGYGLTARREASLVRSLRFAFAAPSARCCMLCGSGISILIWQEGACICQTITIHAFITSAAPLLASCDSVVCTCFGRVLLNCSGS